MSTSSSSEPSEPDRPSHPPTNEVVIGRWQHAYYWFAVFWLGIGFWGVFGSAFDSQTTPDLSKRIAFGGIVCLFFFLPGLLLVWATIRVCVVADASGLRWRGIGGWKSATWPQVRNYYYKPYLEQAFVETENGSLSLYDLTHHTLLKQAVQERAKWADAKTWEMKCDPKNTLKLNAPEIFTANRNEVREFGVMLAMVGVIMPLLLIYSDIPRWDAPLILYQNLEQTRQTMGFWWAWGTILLGLFFYLVCVTLVVISWPRNQLTRRQQGESITVSPEGILLRNAITGHQTWSPWEDVINYYIDFPEPRYVVNTTHGEIKFVGYSRSVRLRSLIQKYCAEHGLQLEWERKCDREQSPLIEQPFQIYNYRCRDLRAMLWLPLFLVFLFWSVVILRYFGWIASKESGDEYGIFFFAIPLTLGTAWLVLTYFRFQIITDESGITQYNGWRSQFISWPDITEYENVSGYLVVRGPHQTIRCWNSITNRKKLQDVIRMQAVNSKTQSW